MNHEFWYLSRAAGFTAYLLLFASVALGISITTRLSQRRRNVIYDLHRFTTILALAFSAFHVLILLGDNYFNFSIWQLTIPFVSPYRSWQTAAGVFSFYMLILLVLSFYVRRFIGYRAWRALHFGTFAMFAAVALHGVTAGTDTTAAWARLIYIGTFAATVGLIIYRVQYRLPEEPSVRATRFVAAGATMLTTLLLVFATGLVSGGNGGASSTDALAAAGAGPNTGAGASTASIQYPFLDTFDTSLAGTYSQTHDEESSSLVIDSDLSGDLTSKLHIELVQEVHDERPDHDRDDGESEHDSDDEHTEEHEAAVTTNTVVLQDAATATPLCTGTLTALRNGVMRISCEGEGPYAGVEMAFSSQIQAADDGTLTGDLSGSMRRTD
jgi:hypothetical protein